MSAMIFKDGRKRLAAAALRRDLKKGGGLPAKTSSESRHEAVSSNGRGCNLSLCSVNASVNPFDFTCFGKLEN